MPAGQFSLIGQKQQLSADQQDTGEENETVSLWLLLHDGASAKPPRLTPACPECQFTLIGAQLKDEGKTKEREEGREREMN